VISEDIKNLRKIENTGRIIVIYHCSQAIYIEEGFLLDRRDSYKNRYHFEKDRETIKENDTKERDKDITILILLLRENKCKKTTGNLEEIITKKLLFFRKQ